MELVFACLAAFFWRVFNLDIGPKQTIPMNLAGLHLYIKEPECSL